MGDASTRLALLDRIAPIPNHLLDTRLICSHLAPRFPTSGEPVLTTAPSSQVDATSDHLQMEVRLAPLLRGSRRGTRDAVSRRETAIEL